MNGTVHRVQAGNLRQARDSEVFLSGHCHSWALAAYEATGFDLVAFRSPDPEEGWVRHFAVQHPDGKTVVDIDGAILRRCFERDTGWLCEHVGTPDAMTTVMRDSADRFGRVWQPVDVDAARSFVEPVFNEMV